MADISDCYEMTAGYGGFNRFNSGKMGIGFDCTGNSSERIFGKDPTVCVTAAVLYLDYAMLSCGTGSVNFVDGSDGDSLFGVAGCTSLGGNSQEWDFQADPLMCLTAESTSSLCISADNGEVRGFIKVHWGSP